MNSLASRIWMVVRFGILALFITILAGGAWTALLRTNLATSPAIPWAIIVMALFLWLIWKYLDGKGWPSGTSEARHRYLRARMVSPCVFAWALLAGVLSIVALIGFWIVLFQLVKTPGNALPGFSRYPLVTVALALAMASVVGAVTEEAAFRGYFQSVLEREFNAPAAIVIAAVFVAPGHGLTQGFVWTTLLFYFFVDVIFGTMAYITKSILPGILVHGTGLLTFFALVWPYDATRRLVSEGGAGGWFWAHGAQAIIFMVLAILAFRHLAKLTEQEQVGGPPGSSA